MASVEIKSNIQISVDEIIKGVSQLETSEIEKFLEEVSNLLTQRKRQEFAERETELLEKVKHPYPSELKARYNFLTDRMKADEISTNEHQELIEISNRFEEMDAQRLQWLLELSKIRNQPLEQLLKELNLPTSSAPHA